MSSHQLLFNDSKTEFFVIGSRQKLLNMNIDCIHVGASQIKPVSSVRNLGALFNSSLSVNEHVGKECSEAFRGLNNIL